MKLETVRCDLCGRVCTNKYEEQGGFQFCRDCLLIEADRMEMIA